MEAGRDKGPRRQCAEVFYVNAPEKTKGGRSIGAAALPLRYERPVLNGDLHLFGGNRDAVRQRLGDIAGQLEHRLGIL